MFPIYPHTATVRDRVSSSPCKIAMLFFFRMRRENRSLFPDIVIRLVLVFLIFRSSFSCQRLDLSGLLLLLVPFAGVFVCCNHVDFGDLDPQNGRRSPGLRFGTDHRVPSKGKWTKRGPKRQVPMVFDWWFRLVGGCQLKEKGPDPPRAR